MATVAVFNPTLANSLVSVGDDPGIVTAPLLKTPTEFSDGTPLGSPVDFGRHQWNATTRVFDVKAPQPPTVGQVSVDALIAKSPSTWLLGDVATAMQLILKGLRGNL